VACSSAPRHKCHGKAAKNIVEVSELKAAVLVSLGQPLEIMLDVEVPEPGRGQVLVRLAYSGVCHSQLMETKGARGADPYVPHLLGHEGSGRIEKIGAGVSKVRVGDLVILGWIKGSGLDGNGTRYLRGDTVINAGGVTTFNEFAVVSENRCVPLPEGVPLDVAVLFGCALLTGAGIVINELKPVPDANIAIFGLGGIGLSALMATLLYKFTKVIAVDINEAKLAMAKEFGATHTIDANATDPVSAIRGMTGGEGVDYSVEASGSPAVIEAAFNSVRRRGGLCVFASHPPAGSRIQLDPYELICGKQIRGSWGGASHPDVDVPKLAALYTAGKLPLEKLISKPYRLEDINNALSDLEAQKATRPLIELDNSLGERL
jgi:S-(hydroxymethyl)glutathione dehydrogenase / alcohol dehydrogenase